VLLSWEWSYGDSNPGPLACHTRSGRRLASPRIALRGADLGRLALDTARRRLAPGDVGSRLGSPEFS
jgi:hypothetical protein